MKFTRPLLLAKFFLQIFHALLFVLVDGYTGILSQLLKIGMNTLLAIEK